MNSIGIDIGGTAIKLAVISDGGEIIKRAQAATPVGDPAALAQRTAELVKSVCPNLNGVPVGAACAGDVDPETGIVTADNLNWTNVPLGELLENALAHPVYIEQDTHAAMMAEWASGSLMGERNALYLTLGTGVGGGAILGGRPYREIRRQGSEFGHMITHANGEHCPCGENGCYERYASASALVRMAHGYDNAKDIIDGVKSGSAQLLPIWEKYIDEVCVGLVGLMSIFYPEVISIGGGISAAGDFLLDSIKSCLNRHEGYVKYYHGTQLRLAKFCNDAGALGAAAAARRAFKGEQ